MYTEVSNLKIVAIWVATKTSLSLLYGNKLTALPEQSNPLERFRLVYSLMDTYTNS